MADKDKSLSDDKSRKRKFPREVMDITSGKQARARRAYNAGDFGESKTAQDKDRLARAIDKSSQADLKQRQDELAERPLPGEVREAVSSTPEDVLEKQRVEVFLSLAKERFKLCAEAESHMRKDALDDLDFRTGKQWASDIETQRNLDGRPCLKMNRIKQFISQVTNDQRQQRPSIQVNPVGDGADQDTADILQGITRHIEVNSDAEIAYDTAFEQMVTVGFGYFRLMTDYIKGKSGPQEIKIKRIKNQFSVYFDPTAIEADYSDARYCFVVEDMPISEYKKQYGSTEAASLVDFTSIGDQDAEWSTKETIKVAEYFHVEETSKRIVTMQDGSEKDESELQEGEEALVASHRPELERKVVWSKINAIEIIEEQDWPGTWIPIIPVIGDDLEVNGRRHVAGLVRWLKDPQRMYNYWVSAATEAIALAPKAPYIVAEGQLEGFEEQWRQANVKNFAYLTYKSVDTAGKPVAPPQRNAIDTPIQAMMLMVRQADNDLKATAGIYDASLGEKGPDQSGKAILARQKQGDVANLNFSDNLARSIRFTARQLIDLIPKVYEEPRVQRIINPDQSVDHVVVHNGADQLQQAQGMVNQKVRKIYDISVGLYDVTVSVGPSYQSKRQEAVAAQMALVSAYPNVMQVAGDILVRNMDWPGHNEIADRLKKTIPPNVLDENDDSPENQVQVLRAQLQQMGQSHDLLVKALNDATKVINEKQIEAKNRYDIEKMKTETQILLAEISAKTTVSLAQIKASTDAADTLQQHAHERAMQADEFANAPEPAGGTNGSGNGAGGVQ